MVREGGAMGSVSFLRRLPCGDEGYHEVPAADTAYGVVARRDFCQVYGC